jgi:hypothetical protein
LEDDLLEQAAAVVANKVADSPVAQTAGFARDSGSDDPAGMYHLVAERLLEIQLDKDCLANSDRKVCKRFGSFSFFVGDWMLRQTNHNLRHQPISKIDKPI